MDELLIGEKKYVSSKRAAQMTGYAKDYVGQLCREGRVPARLVGRSWYVLESAIQDHRFGTKDINLVETSQEVKENRESLASSTWETPRYEAVQNDFLPTPERATENTSQDLQDSWKSWFEHIEDKKEVQQEAEYMEPQKDEENVIVSAPEQKGSEEVAVPITTIYDLPPKGLLPRPQIVTTYADEEDPPTQEPVEGRIKYRAFLTSAVQLVAVVVALAMAGLAMLGSGYLDTYIVKDSLAGSLSGLLPYNK